MRILFLTRYESLGASSRVRAMQYFRLLANRGWKCEKSALLSNRYVQRLYSNRSKAIFVIHGYIKRIFKLLESRRYDLLWIEKELFPFFPPIAEMLLKSCKIPFIVDYDDAIFHTYDLHKSKIVRLLLGGKIDKIMKIATLVTAGNEYLAARARLSGARWVEIIPTTIDLRRYHVNRGRGEGPLVIGWIGSPATTQYLQTIARALSAIQSRYDVRVRLVGASPVELEGVTTEIVPWSESKESELISSFDIGIMPLPDSPWERGKCGYKLIQYMACGLPVIASAVGVNKEIVRHGENGYLASTSDEWEEALAQLVEKRDLRDRLGRCGRKVVEEAYTVDAQGPRLVEYMQAVGKR